MTSNTSTMRAHSFLLGAASIVLVACSSSTTSTADGGTVPQDSGSSSEAGVDGGGAALACGITPVGSCTLKNAGVIYKCTELQFDDSAACAAAPLNGTWSTGTCSTASLKGCCKFFNPANSQTTVACEYPTTPNLGGQAGCATQGGTWCTAP